MIARVAERIIGIVIIFVGLALFVFGSLPLVALMSALVTDKPIPDFGGNWRGFALALGGALSATAYGWQCVKGFKNK